jgi:hypothetical protein
MGGFRRRKSAVVVLVSATLIAGIQSCTTLGAPLLDVTVLARAQSFPREAAGGGLVTVNTAALSGPLADWNKPPAAPTTYAFLSNNGENGKREKRYDLKTKFEAYYELVLSTDPGSTQTKWELFEVKGPNDRKPHGSGHLWQCEAYAHTPTYGEVGFKDCPEPIPYDYPPAVALRQPSFARFASSVETEDAGLTVQNAPIWISCTTGCCSLGR